MFLKSLLYAASVFLFVPVAFAGDLSTRIINGTDSPAGIGGASIYPWMASLKLDGRHFCGGVLINSSYVLTAAHCAENVGFVPDRVTVTLGVRDLMSAAGVTVGVSGVISHPLYDPGSSRYDVALIKLAAPVSVPAVAVASPFDNALYTGGVTTLALGWGAVSVSPERFPRILQQVFMPLRSNAECSLTYDLNFEPESMICAGVLSSGEGTVDGIDTCFGDSGGPLLAADSAGTPKVIGLTSFGFGDCANATYYGVYARTASVYSFIHSNPSVTPRPIIKPSITGVASPRRRLLCATGKWIGDAPTTISYRWIRSPENQYDGGGGVIPNLDQEIVGATSRSYLVTDSDIENSLSCAVTFENSGGKFSATSNRISVSVNSDSSNQNTTVPLFLGSSCDKKLCQLQVQAGMTDDYQSVLGLLVDSRPVTESTKKKKPTKLNLRAVTIDGETWTFKFRAPKTRRFEFLYQAQGFDRKKSSIKRVRIRAI